jgi:hypothetical protein
MGGECRECRKNYRNMGVTYSSAGEYGNAIDILRPIQSGTFCARLDQKVDAPAR